MSWIVYLIVLAIQGLIFGALARLALPGKDPMSIPMTIGLGIAGSFIGGLLVYVRQRRAQGRRVLRRLPRARSAWSTWCAAAAAAALLSPDAASRERRGRRGYR